MRLLEGIGTIVFGLWMMSQGTEPGASIMILLGLPVVLFGVAQTITGFGKWLKEEAPDVSELAREQSAKDHDLVSVVEDALFSADSVERESLVREQEMHVGAGQSVQEQRSRRTACPGCGAKYNWIDRVAQPTMCSKCWKENRGRSIR